jgi:hypothetical protein
MEGIYLNECDSCKFIETFEDVDIYVCSGQSNEYVIARFGEGPQNCVNISLEDLEQDFERNSEMLLNDGTIVKFRDHCDSDPILKVFTHYVRSKHAQAV